MQPRAADIYPWAATHNQCLLAWRAREAVAAAEGVPGIPINIAEIDPPVIPPIYVANNNEIPVTGSIVKVKGSIKANAIEYVNPGIAPNTIPAKAPMEMAIMTYSRPGEKRECRRSTIVVTSSCRSSMKVE